MRSVSEERTRLAMATVAGDPPVGPKLRYLVPAAGALLAAPVVYLEKVSDFAIYPVSHPRPDIVDGIQYYLERAGMNAPELIVGKFLSRLNGDTRAANSISSA